MIYVDTDPALDRIRSDARFADLVRRIGLPACAGRPGP
jgi:hypothetical protein